MRRCFEFPVPSEDRDVGCTTILFAQYVGAPQVPWYSYLINALVLLLGAFLMLVVLIQRGKGGGLSGAFGGVGGSSAFGSKAGDFFTRFTIGVAAVWLLLVMIEVKVIQATAPTVSSEPTPAQPAEAPPPG